MHSVSDHLSPELVARLPELYPNEHERLARDTNLQAPVFCGPRFRNTNL